MCVSLVCQDYICGSHICTIEHESNVKASYTYLHRLLWIMPGHNSPPSTFTKLMHSQSKSPGIIREGEVSRQLWVNSVYLIAVRLLMRVCSWCCLTPPVGLPMCAWLKPGAMIHCKTYHDETGGHRASVCTMSCGALYGHSKHPPWVEKGFPHCYTQWLSLRKTPIQHCYHEHQGQSCGFLRRRILKLKLALNVLI